MNRGHGRGSRLPKNVKLRPQDEAPEAGPSKRVWSRTYEEEDAAESSYELRDASTSGKRPLHCRAVCITGLSERKVRRASNPFI